MAGMVCISFSGGKREGVPDKEKSSLAFRFPEGFPLYRDAILPFQCTPSNSAAVGDYSSRERRHHLQDNVSNTVTGLGLISASHQK